MDIDKLSLRNKSLPIVRVKPSNSGIRIRPFLHGDISAGLDLCRIAGWNQLQMDWECLLAIAPDGLFAAEESGRVCGTASAVLYPPALGWIGMILVHPDWRGRGIAAALMEACIAHLRAKGARTIKLDATDLGRPVYLKLGFREEQPIHRVRLVRPPQGGKNSGHEPHDDQNQTVPAWFQEMDRMAFGADRSALITHLARFGNAQFFSDLGEHRAGALARPGFHSAFLGPVVATDTEAGKKAILSLISRISAKQLMADIFPAHTECARLFTELGFQVERQLVRMSLGDPSPAAWSPNILSAAGFELG